MGFETMTFNETDVAATLVDRPELGIVVGEVGSIVCVLRRDVFEIEFVDEEGAAYATAPFQASELLKLHHRARAA